MEEAKFYWTMVVAAISAGWVLMMFIRDRRSQSIALTSAIVTRLLEVDKVIIEHPDIPRFLCKTAREAEAYFRTESVLEDDAFYKSKTYVYRILNSFDEILSVSLQTEKNSILNPLPLIEPSDWKEYIIITLRHPLYRSVLDCEGEVFGECLRTFWDKNKDAIRSTPVDPFTW